MADFEPLLTILSMDFSQLRALNGRATDNAILLLVTELNNFFCQFSKNPANPEEKQKFSKIMGDIIQEINKAEMVYYKEKNQTNEVLETVDLRVYTITFEKLPTRMQYWAAGEQFGDTIRNSAEHRKAVKHIQQWNRNASSYKTLSMFKPEEEMDNPSDENTLENTITTLVFRL